ncbi:hypothetical protein B0A55_05142 [Friedmanniomyces simplex]|uniref:SET domain-containing protein n=1 Tax=Friedmanniomyces simplex TaxID=329884 RepID=A0A4U0XFR9_9PEZI|nr:hypothetical protein B0A55_05142 [Friedmanniomyces simplex]
MDHLPGELADLIVTYCDFTTLKHLRLLNKLYKDAATPLVFEHFYMGYFPYHLQNLSGLAKSPMAKHVQKFTFFSDIIPHMPQRVWQDMIDFRPSYKDWSEARKAERRKDCQSCAQKPDACENCAGSFFKLGTHLVCATPFQGRANDLPVWRRLRKQIHVGPDEWMYSKHEQTDGSHTKHIGDGQAALCLLEAIGFRAQFAGTKPITKLTVQNTHRQPYMDLLGATVGQGGQGRTELTVPAHRLRYQNVLEAFKHLTELNLDVPHAAAAEMTVARFSDDEFIQLFGVADIHSLFACFNSGDATGLDANRGDTSRPYWPHLEHLALLTNVSYPQILDFLRRHASTLKSLELRDMIVTDVRGLLLEIPKVLDLEHVYVESIWSWTTGYDPNSEVRYERAVKAYLLRQADKLPELRAGGARELDQWKTMILQRKATVHESPAQRSQPDISRGTLIVAGQLATRHLSGLTNITTSGSTNAALLWQTCGDLGWINHSCTPNVEVSETPNPRTFNVYAIRDVAMREELAAAYVSPYQTWTQRDAALPFLCQCSICKVVPTELFSSDFDRRLIAGYLATPTAFRARNFGHLAEDDVMKPTRNVIRSIKDGVQVQDVQRAAEGMLDASDRAGLDSETDPRNEAYASTNDGAGTIDEEAAQEMVEAHEAQMGKKRKKEKKKKRKLQHADDHEPDTSTNARVGGGDDERLSRPTVPWRSFTSPTHGQGLCAARDIEECELIISEIAGYDIPRDVYHDQHSLLDELRFYPQELKVAMMKMTKFPTWKYGRPLDNEQDFDRALQEDLGNVLRHTQNMLQSLCFFFVKGHAFYRLCPRVWRVNHSCEPNAEASWNPETKCFSIRALAPIWKSQEITVSYVSMYQDTHARWKALGFKCNCKVCRSRDSDLARFKAREARMAVFGAGLTKLQAYRAKHPCEVADLTYDVARKIRDDPEIFSALEVVDKMAAHLREGDVMTADFAPFYEDQYFIGRVAALTSASEGIAKLALGHKRSETRLLALCLGDEHPRSQAAYQECVLMQIGEKEGLAEGVAESAVFDA